MLAVPPINQTVMEGDEVEFSCITKNRDTTVAWYKDSVPLTQLLDILHRSRIAMDGSLTISPTAMGDLGEYQCEATNPYGESQAARAFLNVQCKFVFVINIIFNFISPVTVRGYSHRVQVVDEKFLLYKATFKFHFLYITHPL